MINEEITERKPLVIGIGGLLDRNESGRVSDMLRILHNDGFATYNVYFSGIVRDGSTIICNFSLDYVNDVERVIKTAQEDERADSTKTGVIATSMGAAIFSYFLAQNTQFAPKIKAYATISPFTKINQHPQLSKMLEQHIKKEIDLDIGTPYDKQNGIKRIIPHKNIKNITSIDINSPLKACNYKWDMPILTLIGIKDERVDIESMREYHKILDGNPQNLKEYNHGHNIPYEEMRDSVINFMREKLSDQNV